VDNQRGRLFFSLSARLRSPRRSRP
jgi:hypothetical protein